MRVKSPFSGLSFLELPVDRASRNDLKRAIAMAVAGVVAFLAILVVSIGYVAVALT